MASDKDDDETLLAAIQRGEHAAFAVLVKRHASRFYRLAFRFTGRRAEAEDLVQDAFLSLWENPQGWQADKNTRFTTWFYRVVVNRCLNWSKRQRHVSLPEEFEIADEAMSQEEKLAMTEEQSLLDKEIALLPERQRVALNLCFYEGVSNAEAAELMGIGIKALQSLIMRAKATLKERMEHLVREYA